MLNYFFLFLNIIFKFNNWWVMLITFFIAIFVEIALLCSRNLARRVPINYILLFIFTASFSYAISYTCKFFRL
jgi:protein lifeguard